MIVNTTKNRNRDPYTFANVNLLGKCNADCFFCLGKDIEHLLCKQNQMDVHFLEWENFDKFLALCSHHKIEKIYLTGQNTDPTLYSGLRALIGYIQSFGFSCGIRTNGFAVHEKMLEDIALCRDEIGYSIHTLDSMTSKMIMGRKQIPDWGELLTKSGPNVRVSIVLNRCNEYELFDILRFTRNFPNLRYIQVRRISTDTRLDILAPDMAAYERVYTTVSRAFPLKRRFVTDAEVYDIYGQDVVFWRTIKTSANSINYFTDGTISEKYFIIEGYLDQHGKQTETE
jgi:molybdenum cofactor biosynthesis enzyme MoaA